MTGLMLILSNPALKTWPIAGLYRTSCVRVNFQFHAKDLSNCRSKCHPCLQGLGKTLQSLMLILSNPAPQTWPVADLSQHQADEGEAVPIKTTLIVMPANLLQQWQDEIAKHVQDKAVSW